MVISPYPKKEELICPQTAKKYSCVHKPEDELMWLELVQSLSEESIRYRFFQMLKDTPHEVRVRYCNIDYDRESAIVAEIIEKGKKKLLGVGRLVLESDGKNGEIAFIVSDCYQGLGLGTKMVDYVLDLAKGKGVESVYAIMLPDNYRALSLTKKMGFKIDYLSDGTIKANLNLQEEDIDIRCKIPLTSSKTPEINQLNLPANPDNKTDLHN
jgi:acetyltransferase